MDIAASEVVSYLCLAIDHENRSLSLLLTGSSKRQVIIIIRTIIGSAAGNAKAPLALLLLLAREAPWGDDRSAMSRNGTLSLEASCDPQKEPIKSGCGPCKIER